MPLAGDLQRSVLPGLMQCDAGLVGQTGAESVFGEERGDVFGGQCGEERVGCGLRPAGQVGR